MSEQKSPRNYSRDYKHRLTVLAELRKGAKPRIDQDPTDTEVGELLYRIDGHQLRVTYRGMRIVELFSARPHAQSKRLIWGSLPGHVGITGGTVKSELYKAAMRYLSEKYNVKHDEASTNRRVREPDQEDRRGSCSGTATNSQ